MKPDQDDSADTQPPPRPDESLSDVTCAWYVPPGTGDQHPSRATHIAGGSETVGDHRSADVAATGRYFGDYELLREVARGGMGVVYEARQRKLNRTVALKMILSGSFAAEDDVKRFYAEAEAAAQLDHVGIVPVFEVGRHEGLHYLAMAFIDGPSLWQRVRESPCEPREAARLMQQVAEAVQYAHEKGIVHRDLKPQNILLTKSGQPKVTDFGLAKRTAAHAGLTATGQVMGTPSYMPPEQAAGKLDQVGPLADVYSLGATLYCLLTGRPPFQAANVISTLQQVLDDPPSPPRLLNSSVPADLQSICLQCLEKDPRRRYRSCADLAADLGRWLEGESIQASGQSWKAKLVRTLHRNRDDVKLRSWGSLLLWFGAIVFLGEVGIYWHSLGGPPYPYQRALLLRTTQFVAMAVAFIAYRSVWRTTTAAVAEQMWSLWLGFLIGCHLIALTLYQLHSRIAPDRPLEALVAYPYFAILSGLLFTALGRSYWGFCYAFGGLFFLLAILFPHCLPLSPLIFGGTWGLILVLLGLRLRGLSDD